MRRDYFELEVENVNWVDEGEDPRKPQVNIDFRGPADSLEDRFAAPDGDTLEASETDVAFRLQEDHRDDPEATGVVGVTNRITGDFILELNESADNVLRFIRAARAYGKAADGDGRYRVEVSVEEERLVSYEKETFLVYDSEGNLLRRESLIPSGVEL